MTRLHDEEKGFVLSGVALLLVLPAMVVSSYCLVMISEGSEAVSLQGVADRVNYTGLHLENVVKQMENDNVLVNNATLTTLSGASESYTGLLVTLSRSDNIVSINVRDPREIARYSSTVDLTGI